MTTTIGIILSINSIIALLVYLNIRSGLDETNRLIRLANLKLGDLESNDLQRRAKFVEFFRGCIVPNLPSELLTDLTAARRLHIIRSALDAPDSALRGINLLLDCDKAVTCRRSDAGLFINEEPAVTFIKSLPGVSQKCACDEALCRYSEPYLQALSQKYFKPQ